jgi:DNA-binding MarR family transcriptional regulator/GNAT superfamily N-acetyltransferase
LAILDFSQRVAVMSRFIRFCERQLGQPTQGSRIPLSRTAARVLTELAERKHTTATQLGAELGLDAGYLSRLLRVLRTRLFVTREPSPSNPRQSVLSLARRGQQAAAKLDDDARRDIGNRLRILSEDDQQRLVGAMLTVESILGPRAERPASSYLLRPPAPGDMGWVVQRHAALYARESGWDDRYEAKVAEFVAWFLTQHDPARECSWIAERDDENVGSVFLVKESPGVGRIRLLLVDPKVRRSGIGTRLVRQCVGFARRTGYQQLVLSARTPQGTTRHLYDALGFRLVREEWEQTSGRPVVGQTWQLTLEGSPGAAQ